MPDRDEQTLKRESNARLDRLHDHVQQVLDGTIPEAAPFVTNRARQYCPSKGR